MKISRFFFLIGALFLIALVSYLATTPRGTEIPLVGIVTGNEVIVSPQISGRMVRLLVDEGSEVKAGQLIAEMDASELEAQRDSAAANVRTLEARVAVAQKTWGWTDEQTEAAVRQVKAALTAARANLAKGRADLRRAQLDYQRAAALFQSGVVSPQDRDHAETAYHAAEATVKALEDQEKAQEAQLAVAKANRKQLDVQQSDLAATRAQLAQARAAKDEAETRLGYTKIFAPLSGIVSVRVAREGEVVQAGAPIVTLVDIDHLWVQTDVEESSIDTIRFGEKMRVRMMSGEIVEGTVFFKGVENEFATQRDVSRTKRDIKTFAIKLAIPNPNRRFFVGMTATVLMPPVPEKVGWWQRRFGGKH